MMLPQVLRLLLTLPLQCAQRVAAGRVASARKLALLIGTRVTCPCGVVFELSSLRTHIRKRALPGRLELPTLRLTASRSNQLSYGSKWAEGVAACQRSSGIPAIYRQASHRGFGLLVSVVACH